MKSNKKMWIIALVIDTLTVTADSKISVGSGNINLTLSRGTDCRVNAQAGSGNVTVADSFSNGAYDMVITSTRGNITIIGKVVD